uniref:Ice-binding family protein n=1 Tax=Adineta environmental sample TaxID=1193592 RepID=A0AAU7VFA4_9BILA
MICPTLRSAANFTVIAASAVTNTGPTIINGNLAISPSVSLTGFNPQGIINGVTELGTATALQAQKDVTTAYNDLKNVPLTAQMTGVDLSGKILEPGVYKFNSAAGMDTPSSILTLNGTGIYIFQVGSTLTIAADSEIRTINGAQASCIFWQVGSSATIGQYSRFVGNILAYASVGFATNVIHSGSIYAQTAAISFISNTVNGQMSCNVCRNISDTLHVPSSLNRGLPQNIPLYVCTMFLVSFFRK